MDEATWVSDLNKLQQARADLRLQIDRNPNGSQVNLQQIEILMLEKPVWKDYTGKDVTNNAAWRLVA